jgi:hypothetical protein
MNKIKFSILINVILLTGFLPGVCEAENDPGLYIKMFEMSDGQPALCYQIDTLTITKDSAQFTMGPGQLILMDFGWDKPSAMIYRGTGRFRYVPPNAVELDQLLKFTNYPSLYHKFENALFFFTTPMDLPLSGQAIDTVLNKKLAEQYQLATENALLYLHIYLPSMLLRGLASENPGDFFYADFNLDDVGQMAFIERPWYDDWYRLLRLKRNAGVLTFDVLGGFSPDNKLPSQRGVIPVDIFSYDINSSIEADGDMKVKCRVNYVPLIDGERYLYFDWYYENEVISAFDSDSAALFPVYKKEGWRLFDQKREESGLGLILNRPMVAGDSEYVDIEFNCDCLRKHGSIFYIRSQTRWYPSPVTEDYARYDLTYSCPDKYEVISCGNKVNESVDNGIRTAVYELERPASYVSFNVGSFRHKEVLAEGYPPVEVYMATELADMSLEGSDFVGVADRLGVVGADVMNSLAFFTSVFGPCPFDTLKASSIPYAYSGQGSPGLISLGWYTFIDEDLEGYQESFRAHVVSRQWWGHAIDFESYRDNWITEGLAEYCGWWFYETSVNEAGIFSKMLRDFRDRIKNGIGPTMAEKTSGLETLPEGKGFLSVGSSAGSMVLGRRLNSTLSTDYTPVVYYRGAYVFHMIRYLLHDFKTHSDDKFAFFLKDLLVKFSDRPITTDGLREVLESHVGGDMSWFFDQWVYGKSIPNYKFHYEVNRTKDGKYGISCRINQERVPDGFKMIVPVTVLFKDDRYIHFRVWVTKPSETIDLPLMPYKPEKVIFNTYDAVLADVDYD